MPIEGKDNILAYLFQHNHLPPSQANNRRCHTPTPDILHRTSLLNNTLSLLTWLVNPASSTLHQYLTMDTSSASQLIDNIIDPRILHATMQQHRKSSSNTTKYNDDNPFYKMAMCRPFQSEFYHAMHEELHILQNIFKCWTLVPRTQDM